jgi:hypothetical protein
LLEAQTESVIIHYRSSLVRSRRLTIPSQVDRAKRMTPLAER